MKKRPRLCACGHEPHEGSCRYGEGGAFGACGCPRTKKSRKGKEAKPPSLEHAFVLLRGAVSAAMLSFQKTLAAHLPPPVASSSMNGSSSKTEFSSLTEIERVLSSDRHDRMATQEKLEKSSAYGKQDLTRAERAVLEVLVARIGKPTTIGQLSTMSGRSKTSSGFQNAVSSLRTRGFVEGSRGAPLYATENASAQVRRYSEAHFWRLTKCEEEIVDALKRRGQALPSEIAERTLSRYSVTSSGFQNALSRLRTLEIVEGSRGQPVKLTDHYFSTDPDSFTPLLSGEDE